VSKKTITISKIIQLAKEGNSSKQIGDKLKLPWRQVAGILGANRKKWIVAYRKAFKKAKEAKTFTKYQLTKAGYRCTSFDTKTGHEYKGIVDLVAVKREKGKPDNLKIILFQVKGGSAKVKAEEIHRLKKARRNVKIYWFVAEKPRDTVIFKKSVGKKTCSIEEIKSL
jgi:hypothetical protein